MDINLTNVSGTDALKILREDPATQDIPVLALSAYAMPAIIASCLPEGFFNDLTRTFKINESMRRLDLALDVAQKPLGLDRDKNSDLRCSSIESQIA